MLHLVRVENKTDAVVVSNGGKRENAPPADRSTANPILSVRPGKITWIVVTGCVCMEIFLVWADAYINAGKRTDLDMVRRLFNITREDGFATWFAVTQTWMVGLTVFAVFLVRRRLDGARWRKVGWLVLSLFFFYMAMDDGSEFHERIGSAFKKVHAEAVEEESPETLGAKMLQASPSYPWQTLFIPFFGAAGLFMVFFLWRELDSWRLFAVVCVAVGLLAAAVVFDFVEGLDAEYPWNLHDRIREQYGLSRYQVRHFGKSILEFMEMLAMTLFWAVFLRHGMSLAPSVELRFQEKHTSQHDS